MELLLAIVVVIPAYILLYHLLTKAEQREQEFYKLKETFLEKYNQKIIDLLKENYKLAKKETTEENTIEEKQPLEIPLDENTRVPIMDGMKVKYDDDEEIVPINIS